MWSFGINIYIWNENNCINLAWFILPYILFGIDHVSSKCLSLTPRLTWHVNGLVELCCFRLRLVLSAVPKNFILRLGKVQLQSWASEWENSHQKSRFTVASVWWKSHQQSHDLGTLSRGNPYSKLGPPSRGNPSKGVWKLVGLWVEKISQQRDDAHTAMQWCNSN